MTIDTRVVWSTPGFGKPIQLSVSLMNVRKERYRRTVEKAMARINQVLVGALQLVFYPDDDTRAQIRIGFIPGKGHWSYLGTVCDRFSDRRNSMNLDPGTDEGARGAPFDYATALHEFGHALGFVHEHQSPVRQLVFNEREVIWSLGRDPNRWSEAETRRQILNVRTDDVIATEYDTMSIMHYVYRKSWINVPATKKKFLEYFDGDSEKADIAFDNLFKEAQDFSPQDIEFLQEMYPSRNLFGALWSGLR